MVRPFATALIAAALALPAAAQAQQPIGVAAGVKNDVRIKKPGTPLPRPVQVKQRIALADQVQTGVKSQLQVLLLDKSVFTVGANARLVIDRYVYDPNRGRQIGATVAKGAFRFMSGKPDRGTGSQIRTPVASIGIRGTIVEGVVGESAALIAAGEPGVGPGVQSDPQTASLIILRGPGRATQGNAIPGVIDVEAGGRSVTVDRPMFAVFVPGPGRAPIGPFRISPRGLMQVQALIFPSVADRLGIRGPADNQGGDPGSVYYPPERQGPSYPPGGDYPPGSYPLGSFPPSTPPGAGPGPGSFVPDLRGLPQPGARQPPRGNGGRDNNPPPPADNGPPVSNAAPPTDSVPGAGPADAPKGKPDAGPGQSLKSAPPPAGTAPPPKDPPPKVPS